MMHLMVTAALAGSLLADRRNEAKRHRLRLVACNRRSEDGATVAEPVSPLAVYSSTALVDALPERRMF
jgi:hypothetical protein